MAKPTPALVTQTKLDNDATRDVKVSVKRTVTYVVDARSAKNLSIPYAVAVGGAVQEDFKTKPKRVSGEGGKIIVSNVDPGTQVALFLNSDAHPNYRKKPVYAVTPNQRDVTVFIKEKSGRCSETDTPIQTRDPDGAIEAAKTADTYAALLSGDTWMKVSHKYSSAEVAALLPPGTSAVVAATVKKIYDGLTKPSVDIVVPAASPGAAGRTISITFDDGRNPRANIQAGYDFLLEGLTRVHPAGYAAVFTAATDAGVNKVAMTSAWRPMLGSIAHRAGLGLDVNVIGATQINREELRLEDAVDTANVSVEEKRLFGAFESSKKLQSSAMKDVAVASAEVKKASGAAELIQAKQRLKEAKAAASTADKTRKDAELAWGAERDKNEPAQVRRFRESLIKCEAVVQLFDPWFMDSNVRDNVGSTPNMQQNDNETLHAHHLHVTVYEPKIL